MIAGQTHDPRAHVIMGGVDSETFSPEPKVEKTGGIIFVGRLLPHKGVDRVIEAPTPEMSLDLIGRPYYPEHFALLMQLAKGKRVTFHHNSSDEHPVDAYRRARCVVLPSLYRDCFGNETRVPELLGQTLWEGMACGIPALCTRVASMPEVVVNEETGWIVPPGDVPAMRAAFFKVYASPDLAAQYGEDGQARVLEHFTWASVVKRCLQSYAGTPVPRPECRPAVLDSP